jgi:hypothetical protein
MVDNVIGTGNPVKVNGSASVRHNVGPDLLQRYEVSLGGPDGEERRCNCGEHQ